MKTNIFRANKDAVNPGLCVSLSLKYEHGLEDDRGYDFYLLSLRGAVECKGPISAVSSHSLIRSYLPTVVVVVPRKSGACSVFFDMSSPTQLLVNTKDDSRDIRDYPYRIADYCCRTNGGAPVFTTEECSAFIKALEDEIEHKCLTSGTKRPARWFSAFLRHPSARHKSNELIIALDSERDYFAYYKENEN